MAQAKGPAKTGKERQREALKIKISHWYGIIWWSGSAFCLFVASGFKKGIWSIQSYCVNILALKSSIFPVNISLIYHTLGFT